MRWPLFGRFLILPKLKPHSRAWLRTIVLKPDRRSHSPNRLDRALSHGARFGGHGGDTYFGCKRGSPAMFSDGRTVQND
jgi:hypothetical protein